ncbi:MAG TPA: response regulator [Cyclobacteriaceae bacterium]|nr:response regulator [Cyclobacteriaceae bacterium]
MEPKILLVEDTPDLLLVLAEFLEMEGYVVRTATNGADAVSILCQEQVDLVMTDLRMPGEDGFQLIDHIRRDKVLTKLPILIYSTLPTSSEQQEIVRRGANAFLHKPSPLALILSTIQQLLS